MVVPLQDPVDVIFALASSVNAQDGATTPGFVQFQDLFSRQDEGLQSLSELDFARIELIHHDFIIPRGHHTGQLSPPPIALAGKIALGGQFRFLARWHAAGVGIQELKPLLIVVAVSGTVLAIDDLESFLQLGYILFRTGVQGLADSRLFRTPLAVKSRLQNPIGTHPFVRFHQPLGSGQHTDESVLELVYGSVNHGFLPDLDPLLDGSPYLTPGELDAKADQTGPGRESTTMSLCGRLSHGDAPPSLVIDQPIVYHKESVTANLGQIGVLMSYYARAPLKQRLQPPASARPVTPMRNSRPTRGPLPP